MMIVDDQPSNNKFDYIRAERAASRIIHTQYSLLAGISYADVT